jgi:hypothetical protein
VHETFLFLIYLDLRYFDFLCWLVCFFLYIISFFVFSLCVCVSISWVRSLSCSLFCWLVGCILLVGWWVWIPPRLMLHYGEWGGDSPVWWVIPFLFFPLLLFSFLLLLHSFDKQHMIMTSLIYRRPYYSEWLFSLSSSFFLLNTYELLLFACPVDEEYDTLSRWWFIILSFSFSLVVLCGFRVGVYLLIGAAWIFGTSPKAAYDRSCACHRKILHSMEGELQSIHLSFMNRFGAFVFWNTQKIYKE